LFDILIFPTDDSSAFDCYKQTVHELKWDSFLCDFSKVEQILNVSQYSASLNSIEELASVDKHVVVDNTPLPKGGAQSNQNLTTMLQVRTDFQMTYNIKNLSMLTGLVCFVLIFMLCGVMYLCRKTRNDVLRKRAKLQAERAEGEGLLHTQDM
jgi:uncharacterized membrane protein YciS (DUF1049 family)